MKQYLVTEELWNLMMSALNKAHYDLVIPIVNKLSTDVKIITPPPTKTTEETGTTNEETAGNAPQQA